MSNVTPFPDLTATAEPTSAEPATPPVNMGLRGLWGQLANLTAVGLLCLMFYQSQQEQYRASREDRTMFREELRVLHTDSDRKWEALHSLTESVKRLGSDVNDLRHENRRAPGTLWPEEKSTPAPLAKP